MPIHVICSGCHKRFTAPDRFAGKRGPCPHCKTIILVPLPENQVVIHEPEEALEQRSEGRSIFKPLRRESQGFSRFQMVMVGIGILFVLLLAILCWILVSPSGASSSLAMPLDIRNTRTGHTKRFRVPWWPPDSPQRRHQKTEFFVDLRGSTARDP